MFFMGFNMLFHKQIRAKATIETGPKKLPGYFQALKHIILHPSSVFVVMFQGLMPNFLAECLSWSVVSKIPATWVLQFSAWSVSRAFRKTSLPPVQSVQKSQIQSGWSGTSPSCAGTSPSSVLPPYLLCMPLFHCIRQRSCPQQWLITINVINSDVNVKTINSD